ncbi:hypothetical protein XPA_000611 [Xanthoria parietina]
MLTRKVPQRLDRKQIRNVTSQSQQYQVCLSYIPGKVIAFQGPNTEKACAKLALSISASFRLCSQAFMTRSTLLQQNHTIQAKLLYASPKDARTALRQNVGPARHAVLSTLWEHFRLR